MLCVIDVYLGDITDTLFFSSVLHSNSSCLSICSPCIMYKLFILRIPIVLIKTVNVDWASKKKKKKICAWEQLVVFKYFDIIIIL